jgi:hypothetical protein
MRSECSLIGWLPFAGLVACGPVIPGAEDTVAASTTTSVVSTTGTPTTEASTMVLPTGESTGSTGSLVSTGSSTGGTGTDGFLQPKDGGIAELCNIFTQDCPPGMKCMPYANDGGSSWNSDKCVPVVDDPKQVGESCFAAEGGVGGVDDCDLGLMCWDVDVEKNGICFELCGGAPDMPICKALKTTCGVFAEGTLALCFPWCDPLAQDCSPWEVCVGSQFSGFFCLPDASFDEGQLHDSCISLNECDAGLMCVESASAVECDPMQESCCEPFCDITLPETCPGAGQVCNAYFDEGTAPVGCENIGYCRVPE